MGHTTQPCCRVTYGLIILFRSLAEFNSTWEISLLEGGGGQIPTLWDVPRRREKEGVRNVIVLGPFKFWVFQTEPHYFWNLGLGRMRLLIGGQVFPESCGDKCNRGCQVVTRQDGKGVFPLPEHMLFWSQRKQGWGGLASGWKGPSVGLCTSHSYLGSRRPDSRTCLNHPIAPVTPASSKDVFQFRYLNVCSCGTEIKQDI